MKKQIFFAALLLLSPAAGLAQDTDTTGSITPPAEDTIIDTPAAGENSFTEAQVRARLTNAGYSSIGTLDLDTDGIWRTTAMKDGELVGVAFDHKGNIVER
jgi:hypothetical protein